MSDGRRYRVLGVLGAGGFGTVYRAELLGPSGFTRTVALKVLNPQVEQVRSIAERLRDEARLLGMIRHRAIVQVDGLVQLDDRWTVVMEYIEGVDLSRLIARGPTPARPALEIIGEAAGALHVARTWKGPDGVELGLLHRDVKPQNILITAAGETKVLDFGVARADFGGREAVTQGMWFGSPGYVAPERMDGEEGPEADVFALGVVLVELLTGQPVGPTSARRARHEAVVERALARLEDQRPEVRALAVSLLAHDPSGRLDARALERRCRELVSEGDGPFLRDWAEEVVPALLATPPTAGSFSHEFSGSILVERTGAGETSFQVLEDPSGEWGSLGGPEALQPPAPEPTPPEAAAPLPVAEPLPVDEPLPAPQPPVRRRPPRRRGAGLGTAVTVLIVSLVLGVGVTAALWLGYLFLVVLLAASGF